MRTWGSIERYQMEQVQCYIGLRASHNSTELSDIPNDRYAHYSEHVWHRVHTEMRVNKTRWVVLRWPTSAMAQQAQMSTDAFEDFYFDVCTVDYRAMAESMKPLKELMEKTDQVKILGPETNLEFSIKDIPVVGCSGHRNIPDGEMFTSPVLDSIEGVIKVNTQSLFRGIVFDNISFKFSKGKIIEAHANHQKALDDILNTDEGARRIGEFSLAFNPRIMNPMLDTLFDEKIAGSFHFTPGQAYEEADNGNRSEIHWDLVVIQRSKFGGGEIYFDNRLVRKDGIFVDKLSGAPLFDTRDRFNSGTGWLSFTKPIDGSVYRRADNSYGMRRIEIRSTTSDIHLGHVFPDGPNGLPRYCINATVLEFKNRTDIDKS